MGSIDSVGSVGSVGGVAVGAPEGKSIVFGHEHISSPAANPTDAHDPLQQQVR